MKYKKIKKAFTIVELVIVIAIVAILAAVLIPVFVNVTKEAKISADTSLVKNLNTALSIDEALNDKPVTMTDALSVAADSGYSADKISPVSSGEIVWDSVSNRFALINGDKVVYQDGSTKSLTGTAVWKMTKKASDLTNTDFSWYLQTDGDFGTSVTAATGIDVGENENIDVTISSASTASANSVAALSARFVTASAAESKAIVVRTNGGTLTISVSDFAVSHYGTANSATIHCATYYEYGTVGAPNVTGGEFVLGNTCDVGVLIVSEGASKVTYQAGASVEVVLDNSSTAEISVPQGTTLADSSDSVKVGEDGAITFTGFDGGTSDVIQLGTETFPYVVSTSKTFEKIAGLESDAHFSIESDITIERNSENNESNSENKEFAFANNGTDVVLDFNGNQLICKQQLQFNCTINDSITIKNATISNQYNLSSLFLGGDITLENCTVKNDSGDGAPTPFLVVQEGSRLTIDNCTLQNAPITYSASHSQNNLSRYVSTSSVITVRNSTFIADKYTTCISIGVENSKDCTVTVDNCNFNLAAKNGIIFSCDNSVERVTLDVSFNKVTCASGILPILATVADDSRIAANVTVKDCTLSCLSLGSYTYSQSGAYIKK